MLGSAIDRTDKVDHPASGLASVESCWDNLACRVELLVEGSLACTDSVATNVAVAHPVAGCTEHRILVENLNTALEQVETGVTCFAGNR